MQNGVYAMKQSLSNKIGCWQTDENELPCFNYTGKIPYKAKLENGTDVKLPEDPWFLRSAVSRSLSVIS